MSRRRPPRIYDEGIYLDFGAQPRPLEMQIGYGLVPFVDKNNYPLEEIPLLNEFRYVRNEFDAEYGLPLAQIRIRDNMCLEPYEYKLLLHGIEVGGFKNIKPGDVFCMKTVSVTGELSGKKFNDPAFGMDGILVDKDKAEDAEKLGYVVVEPERMISVHLHEIIKRNITRFLDQCMVNTLINKVRDTNPDVIDEVFFMHNFSTSSFKTILNWLLEEGVSIRDMNTILETIADNIDETKKTVELMERIREKLAWQFIPKIADEDKSIHVITISYSLAEALSERIFYPKSNNELPYYVFKPDERRLFEKEIAEKANHMVEKGYEPVFLIVSDLRTALSNTIRTSLGNWTCISDKEVYSVIKDYSVVTEEELEIDEIKVNETCPVCN